MGSGMRAKFKTERRFRKQEQPGWCYESSTHRGGYGRASLEDAHSPKWEPRLRNRPTGSLGTPQCIQNASGWQVQVCLTGGGRDKSSNEPRYVMGLAHWDIWVIWVIWAAYTDVNCAVGRECAGRWKRLPMARRQKLRRPAKTFGVEEINLQGGPRRSRESEKCLFNR